MTLSAAILSTLKYSDHFDFPLTLDEIHLRLVGEESSRPLLSKTIFRLLHSHQIAKHGVYYHLPARHSLVARRLKFEKLSAPLLARAQTLATRLSRFSSVLAIYLTGSLAVNNTDGNSDIDFMIITKNNSLWTTRLLITVYCTLYGLRRTPHSHNNSGKLCLNLYLTPAAFTLPSSRRSLYTAYELIQAVPLYDPHDTHSALLSANSWLNKYLPNYPLPVPQRSDLLRRSWPKAKMFSRALARPGQTLLELLELFLFKLQFLYMKRRITREYITPDAAFFHPHDPSPKV